MDKNTKKLFTESEIDEILSAVDGVMQNLAKSKTETPSEEPVAKAEGDFPPTEELAPEAEGEMESPQMPEPEGEMPMDEGELVDVSDDELYNIYSDLEPEELERHFMIVRAVLREKYGEGEEAPMEEPMEEPAPEAPAPEFSPEEEMLPKAEKEVAKCGEMTPKAEKEVAKCGEISKEEAAEAPAEVAKSENTKVLGELDELKKQNEQLKKNSEDMESNLQKAIQAIELLSKPFRKSIASIADLEVIKKSEEPEQELSKSELIEQINGKVKDPSLSKSDRDAINEYLLYGHNKPKVIEIVRRK